MTKRKSLIATFAFILMLSLALVLGIALFGGTLTAQAASAPSAVTVNGKLLYSGYYLESNDSTTYSTGATTAPATYVAWYDGNTLTLNNYIGGQISAGGDLTIKLKGSNTIVPSGRVGIFVSGGGNLIIDADSEGTTLNINVSSTDTPTGTSEYNDVCGIRVGSTGGERTGNLTIRGKSKVNIDCQATNFQVYGIYSIEATCIADEASIDVKCVSQKELSGEGDSYGIYSNRTPVFNTSGTIKIDTSECATASYCIYAASFAIDMQNGDCLLKYKTAASRSFASYPTMGSAPDGYVMRTSLKDGETVLKQGIARTVTIVNGNDYYEKSTNQYVAGETVTVKTSLDGLTFVKWEAEGVGFLDATQKETTFIMPNKDVTVKAVYDVFAEQPVFVRTGENKGSISVRLNKETSGYMPIVLINSTGVENTVPYFSQDASDDFTYKCSDFWASSVPAGKYRMRVNYNGGYYFYSDIFEIDYTDKTPAANVSDVIVSGKTGREITPVYFDITLSYATFKEIADGTDVSSWFNYLTGGLVAKISAVSEGATSATITISGTPTATATSAIYLNIPKEILAAGNDSVIKTKYNNNAKFNIVKPASYTITMTEGKAQVGGETKTKINEGSMVTIIANDKDGYVFDKWVVVSGGVKLTDENNKETKFVMPESDVEIKATYKKIVNSVEVFVTAPVKDNTADTTTMTVNSTSYSATKVEWYKGEGVVSSMLMGASDKFIAGQSYTVVVTLTVNSGYVFAGDSTLGKSINRQAATLNSGSGTDTITIKTTFDVPTDPIPEHSVTVENGKISGGATTGTFAEGASVTVTANEPETDMMFDKWTVTGVTLSSVQLSSKELTFTMGTSDVTITATYKAIPKYTVTITDGKLADNTTTGSFKAGESVTITADTKEGFTFDKWTATGITLTSEQLSSQTFTFTMGTNDVKLTATYKPIPQYTVTVESGTLADGTTSGSFKVGETVKITADAKEGYTFDKWTVSGITLTSEQLSSSAITITVGTDPITLRATYKEVIGPAPKHNVTVEGGSADGDEYKMGQVVTITAGEAPEGMEFDKWVVVSGGVTLANENNVTTTFVMPSGAVEIKATYKAKTPSGGDNPGGSDNPSTGDPSGELTPTENKGLNGGAIAGIAVGSVAVVGIGGFAIFWFAIKKKSFAELIAAIKGIFKKK